MLEIGENTQEKYVKMTCDVVSLTRLKNTLCNITTLKMIIFRTPYNGAQQFCSRFSADLVEYGDEVFVFLISSAQLM